MPRIHETKPEEQVMICPDCGNTDLGAAASFCDQCGARLTGAQVPGEHKQVTVLFCDVVESMALAATLGPERLREVMHELFNLSAVAIQRYGGMVDKFTGDGLMALFGAPVALEDHAFRACIAALKIQEVAHELAAEVRRLDRVDLRVRVGLNSGEVVVGNIGSRPGSYTAVGQTVGMAQRMESAALPGTVLCSASTAGLAEPRATFSPPERVPVKGEPVPVPARQLLSVSTERPIVGRDEGPLRGRAAELNDLTAAFDTEKGCVVEIVGAPGLGKSRLIREFAVLVEDRGADVVIARCDSHTSEAPLWTLSRMLRAMFEIRGLDDPEARIEVLQRVPRSVADSPNDIGILFELLAIAEEDAEPVEMNLDARRRRLVETMIKAVELRPRRTLFILEDLHWIDPASDATFAEFASTISATESMLVVSYRPEYAGALRNLSEVIVTLEPLEDRVTLEIAAGLIGTDPSAQGLAQLIAEAGAGNPFFVEEIVRDLSGRGVLAGSRGAYRRVAEVGEITVPATVQAVLASRIDRLSVEAKEALNAAAVIGNRFEFSWLQALLPDVEQSQLAELVAVELIDQIEFLPRARYSFRHPLVRTVAYESQLSTDRAGAHRRLADALQSANAANPNETAALIGTHLEAAGDLAGAYGWHMRAADWLQSRDIIAARSSWAHARSLADRLPTGTEFLPALRAAPRAMLAWTEWLQGRDADSQENYEELRELTAETGDNRLQMIGIAGRMTALCTNYGRPMEAAELAADLTGMIDAAETDDLAKADLLFTVMWAQFLACDYPSTLATVSKLRAAAGRAVRSSTARANAVAGVVRLVTGEDPEQGRRDLALGLQQAHQCDPATYAIVMSLQCGLVTVGIEAATVDTLRAARRALAEAEKFGDNFGIVCGLWSCAIMTLRLRPDAVDAAEAMLQRALAIIDRYRTAMITAAPVKADIAYIRAKAGDVEAAIDLIRDELGQQFEDANFTFVGATATILVQLLAARGTDDDIEEANMLTDALEAVAEQTQLAALENCVLLNRCVLTQHAGDEAGYRAAFTARRHVRDRLSARGEFLLLRTLPEIT